MNFLKSWKSCFSILLFHPIEAKIWLLSDSNHIYSLPSIKIAQAIDIDDISLISKTVEEDFGIAINVLHYDSYENAPTDGSAWLSGDSSNKVRRGGSWSDDPDRCRSAYRYYSNRENRHSYVGLGFRVACVAATTI